MTPKMKLILDSYWYAKVEAGLITCDYRRNTEYWAEKLKKLQPGDVIALSKGHYGKIILKMITNIRKVKNRALPKEVYEYFKVQQNNKELEVEFWKIDYVDCENFIK